MTLETSNRRKEFNKENRADDTELISAFRSQDPKAFEEIVKRHSPKIGAYLRRHFSFNFSDVEDIMQETFLKAYLGSSTYEQQATISTWLIAIARYTALSFIRGDKLRPVELVGTFADYSDGNKSEALPVSSHEDAALDRLVVREALKDLKPIMRETVFYAHFGDLSYAAIGEVLGIRLETVKSRLFMGRQVLRKALAPDE